jgi:16S rRNA (guanine527-N7)-methyltransferase
MFHVKHEGWLSVARSAGIDLSPEQATLLERYEDLLRGRGAAIGVVAAADLPRLRERHVLDGLRGAAYLPTPCRRVLDLGSGGGIPGVPVAVARPDVDLVLAEARRNRAAFLELVADTLPLPNASVHAGRVQDLSPGFDACVARAFAPPAEAWEVARRVLRPGGTLLYWAGARFDPGRDTPDDVQIYVPQGDPLAYGGPVVIMSAR